MEMMTAWRCALGVIAFIVLGSAQAAILRERACYSFTGGAFGAYVDSGGIIRPAVALGIQLHREPIDDGMFWPANASDWSGVSSSGCPEFRTTTEVQGIFAGSDDWYGYEITFHAQRVSHGVRNSDGSCRVGEDRWYLGDPDSIGTGVVCSRVVNRPQLEIEPLTLRVNRLRTLRLRATRNGTGVARLPVQLQILAQEGSGALAGYCGGNTNANGYFDCLYRAPQRPITDTAQASSSDAPTVEGAIKVVPPSVVVGFFNGVWNTEKQAQDGLQAIKTLVGLKHGATELRYEKFYNQTGTATGNTALQDIAEVFIQRGKELDGVLANRWEIYWELLAGRVREEGSLTQRLLGGLQSGSAALSNLIDALVSSALAGFAKGLAQFMSNPPTAADAVTHLAKLRGLADESNDFVLAAHSQGNLFVNLAYDGLQGYGEDVKTAVVHVAPASPILRGKHVLADIDAVINGLRNFGSWTVPNTNLWLTGTGGDPSGHTLIGTYLDGSREARSAPNAALTSPRAHLKQMMTDALEQVAPLSP